MRFGNSGVPSVAFYRGSTTWVVTAVMLCSLAGCASGPTHEARVAAAAPQRVGAVAVPVEIEDDGLPAQTPPRLRHRHIPDDPSEPFSPNYGSAPVQADAGVATDGADQWRGDAALPPQAALQTRSGAMSVIPASASAGDLSRALPAR